MTAKSTDFLLICCIFLLLSHAVRSISAIDASSSIGTNQLVWALDSYTCKGSIGECYGDEVGEFDMDSEINRRILYARRYISYGALSRNRVPCSRRGASYYNCRPGGRANPYSRGCSAITRCRY